jgi:D-serine deaminase-like pyridoxal phosphate-dependent protein
VAKLGEAEVLVDGGVADVFVGYPIVGRAKLRRLAELAARCELSVAVDSLAVAEPAANGRHLRGAPRSSSPRLHA